MYYIHSYMGIFEIGKCYHPLKKLKNFKILTYRDINMSSLVQSIYIH